MWESLKPLCNKCYCFMVIIAILCNTYLKCESESKSNLASLCVRVDPQRCKTASDTSSHQWLWWVFSMLQYFLPHVFRPKLDVILRLERERAVLLGSVLGGLFIFFFCLSGFIYYLKETKKT